MDAQTLLVTTLLRLVLISFETSMPFLSLGIICVMLISFSQRNALSSNVCTTHHIQSCVELHNKLLTATSFSISKISKKFVRSKNKKKETKRKEMMNE
jgi:hypothetical protein